MTDTRTFFFTEPPFKLVLNRDPLGLKPLYYHLEKKRIIYSESISSLLADPSVPKKPNAAMIGQFLAGEFLDYESTFFEGIKQVPPGCTLTFKNSAAPKRERFWFPEAITPRQYRNKQLYYEEFFHLFRHSVENAMHGNGPAGLLLSGGLDSSQICAAAETLRRENSALPELKSACLLVEGFLAGEKENVENLQSHFGSDIEFIDYAASQDKHSLFELFLDCGETPHLDAYLTTPLLLNNLASRGCQTLLTGFGANELSNPMENGRLMDLLPFHPVAFLNELGRYSRMTGIPRGEALQVLAGDMAREFSPVSVRRWVRGWRNQKRGWIRKDFRRQMSLEPPARLRPFGEMAQNRSFHALFEPLMPLGLAQMHEAAARYGMEIRHPFLDLPLIEFFLSIPAEIKLEEGYRKSFVQKALAPMVPAPPQKEEGTRCFVPMREGRERREIELGRLAGFLSAPDCLIYEYLDYSGVQAMLDARKEPLNYPLMWRIVRLEVWLKKFFGTPSFLINDLLHAP